MSARRLSCCLILFIGASALRAADKAPPAAPESAESGITAAKRDYEALKGTRTALEQQRLGSAPASAPTTHYDGDDLSAFAQGEKSTRRDRDPKKSAKSSNWLVEAMETKPVENSPGTKTPEAFKAPADREAPTLVSLNAEEVARAAAKNSESVSKPQSPADNPLNTYMASWMTSKDFDLLKVKPAESTASTSPAPAGDRSPDPGAFDGLMRGNTAASPARSVAAPASERAANPYLADFAPVSLPGPRETQGLPAPPTMDFPSATTPPSVQKNEFAPAKIDPPVIDALKPSQDAKYFPQLKRF